MDKYCERMMHLALERRDPRLLIRVCEMRNVVSGNTAPLRWTSALDVLVAALNQDGADQFLLAVISYQRALRFGGEDVSPEAIGARLKEIAAAHRAEYDAGVNRFIEKPDMPNVSHPVTDMVQTINVPGVEPANARATPAPPNQH